MLDLLVLALRAPARSLPRERLIAAAHARHHPHTFAEASRRGRLALAAIAERAIHAGGVALQTPCIEIAMREDGGRRWPKHGRVRFRCGDKGQTRDKERRGDPAKC